jgi:hypothetical protein
MYRSTFAGRRPPYDSKTTIGCFCVGDAYATPPATIMYATITPQTGPNTLSNVLVSLALVISSALIAPSVRSPLTEICIVTDAGNDA